MPQVSIVIPAYNVGPYLQRCLDSVCNQTLHDIEIIVVDDASTDDTPEILQKAARHDHRIVALRHDENKGLHLARKTGVLAATGAYTLMLDGDDELDPNMCEQLVARFSGTHADMLHFGISVIGENGISATDAASFASFINAPSQLLHGSDILRATFDENNGQTMDWRATQRIFNTELLVRGFNAMTDTRLERAEDAYEMFVLCALADSCAPAEDIRGYRYHYGIGVTGVSQISAQRFGEFCNQFHACITASEDFAKTHAAIDSIDDCLAGLKHKSIELLANDWLTRVPEEEKLAAAQQMNDVFGADTTCREIWRFVRDRAYSYIQSNMLPEKQDKMFSWRNIAESIEDDGRPFPPSNRLKTMKATALGHLTDIESRALKEQYDKQRIRIFVTTHKEVDKPQSDILQPVQVGPKSTRFPWAFQDDEGENIADKNPMYCELTTQYWAWKNVDADYYGFCHYRRYFDFSGVEHKENAYGEIMDDYIDAASIKRYGLDDESIKKAIAGADVVTTRWGDLCEIIEGYGSPIKIYQHAPKLHLRDLRHMYDILCEMHPDYKTDADAFLHGHRSCFCNMFIMRKDIFQDYCAWLFSILQKFEETTDMSLYSKEALRTPGHLSERLLNIYLIHHKRIGSGWKVKELQCVHFTHPEPRRPLERLSDEIDPTTVVPVVFAADNNYVPQLTTTIYSAMTNANPDRYYDVTVLQKDIAWENQERMRQFLLGKFKNMNLRFADVSREISGYDLTTSNAHISIETYYRFLIQKALPFYDKVLYLDSDIVINGDIAQLYDTELGDNLLAAVHDIDYQGNLNMNDGKRLKYTNKKLHMKHPFQYFQAGVLVLNTKEMRKAYSIKQWLDYASDPDFIYNDQDVLNAHCEGRVVFLDWSWNVVHDCANRVANVFSFAPNDSYDAYIASRKDPKIIHYAGFEKPWVKPDCDFAPVYWSYARQTPFYEQLIGKIVSSNAKPVGGPKPPRAVGENNVLRKVVDPLAPIGSRRREVLKSVGRAVRGR
ncbi:DUF4422 domain-containing protein [Bifidobacterium thermophilum]|uniref:Family 8 glycosyl transferase n=1 Tax=Bifidobacterium thermophilum RBL67 TaxID=1254439 RepID=M4REQ6_9BIFI|nr:DUF4422 domain-containing protein [Bifidobacterium thermophilum]AGH40654.1 family 8 glycosyl transferase [Bifidobacterium thermophilum RBL67]MDW8486822.1 DUF4422 domain-containing protein [Bifidobacterium thermophilum]